jgi:hypothetical protein
MCYIDGQKSKYSVLYYIATRYNVWFVSSLMSPHLSYIKNRINYAYCNQRMGGLLSPFFAL